MSTKPVDQFFNNASKNREHNVFTEEYFGGADTFVYINGVRYENISAVSFSIREQQKPIYGYGSRTYDDLATGTRIVQGAIKVPVANTNSTPIEALAKKPNNKKEKERTAAIEIPDWLYQYEPDADTLGTENNPYKDGETVQRADVVEVQHALRRNGKNVEVTGIYDGKTKSAIAEYKKEKNIVVNGRIDYELKNRIGIAGDETIVRAKKDNTKLRYNMFDDIPMMLIKKDTRLVVQNEINKDWLLVQMDNGRKGYVKTSEVI